MNNNFNLKSFLAEGRMLKENEGVDELPLTDEIKQDVDNAIERAIQDGEMEKLQTVGYWENDFEDALLMNYEDQHPDAYMISDELHNYIQNKVYGEENLNEERFYAPNYIIQKYGVDKAKEIETNIEDEGANTWDLFTSLETPREVDDFIQGFIN
jgi:hypothetical protein